MNQLKKIWLSALLLFLSLLISHGMFRPIAVVICGAVLFLNILSVPEFLKKINFDRFLIFSLMIFGLIPLFEGIVYPSLIIYAEESIALNLIKVGSAILTGLGIILLMKPIRALLWLAIWISTCMLVFVIFASPHPTIDVWTIHEACAQAVAHFKNPYTTYLPNPYPVSIQATMTPGGMSAFYLPGIYLVMAPFAALGLDTRFAEILALIGIAYLLYGFARRSPVLSDFQKLLVPTLFLANPLNLFMIEQAWNDSIGTFFFLLLLYSFIQDRTKIWILMLAVSGSVLSKQYFLPLDGLVLLWGLRTRKINLGEILLSTVPAVLVFGFFSWLDWRNFWGSLYGLRFLKDKNMGVLDVRWNSLSFIVFLKAFTGRDLSAFGTATIAIAYGWTTYLIVKTETLFSSTRFLKVLTGLLFIGVFLSATSNFNYYFASWTFLFLQLTTMRSETEISFLEFSVSWETPAFIFTRLLIVSCAPILTDVGYYQEIVGKLSEHAIPYLDFHFEYPPLNLFVLFMTKAFTLLFDAKSSFLVFRFAFQASLCCLDFFAFRWLRNHSGQKISLTYLCLPLFLFPLWYDRFDLVVGLILMMAALSLRQKKPVQSFGYILIGGLYKIIPIIELMNLTGEKITAFRDFFSKKNIFFVALLSACLFFSFAIPSAWTQVFEYHSDRPIQAESIWATVDYLYRTYTGSGDFNTFITHSYGAFGVAPYLDIDLISKLAMPIGLMSLALFFFVYYRKKPFRVFHMLIPLMLFFSLTRVFSPQYLIWMVPLIGISNFNIPNKIDRWILLLSFLMCGISSYILANYMAFTNVRMDLWLYLTLRNISCIGMFILLMAKLFEPKVSEDSSTDAVATPTL